MNIRRAAAVGCIALVVGGIAGRIGAATASDDAAPATASTPVAQTTRGLSPAAVYKADAPGIVTVTDSATSAGPSVPFLPQQQQKVEQLGSGFVLDANGDIVTNNHVVAGGSHIRVGFGGDTTYPATVVGTDPASDLAVLRVSAPDSLLHPLAFGASSAPSRATRSTRSATRSGSSARSPRASSAPSGATSRRPTGARSPTRSRRTRRSTTATRAARCSTRTAT